MVGRQIAVPSQHQDFSEPFALSPGAAGYTQTWAALQDPGTLPEYLGLRAVLRTFWGIPMWDNKGEKP